MKYKNIINPKYAFLTQFINDLPSKFDREGMLIYDSRNQVRVFKVDGMKYVVKRFHRSPFHQRFDYTFRRPSKAKRAYTFALKLQELHINTPEPIACIEGYSWGLYKQGYFVSAYCGDPDARILREEWEGHDDLFKALAHFLVDMHEKGFMHGDTNLSNFLYREDKASPTGYCITTIDINRSKFVENPSREDCIRNLMRLTHVRPALKKLVGLYAELRGWNVEWATLLAIQKLEAFEKRRELKKKVTRKH
jgi:tRNA A-37 threonylcarbamoyl transferase component Bud32